MKFALLIPLLFATAGDVAMPSTGGKYPASRKESLIETYHGTNVADPYRWLEDNESAETRSWIEAENQVTRNYLDKLPSRGEFKKRLTELWNYDKLSPPVHRGQRYFYTRLTGLQNQRVLYCAKNPQGEGATVVVDVNTMAKDGTVTLAGYEVSDDGKLLGYGLSSAGSDWTDWHFKNMDTGEELKDQLQWIKFGGVSFTKDGTGVYYGRFPESTNKLKDTNYYHALYFHKLGTEQKNDVLIADNPAEKEWSFSGGVTEDGNYLIVQVFRNTNPENLVYYKDLRRADSPLVHLIDTWEGKFSFICNDGPLFSFETNLNAPRGRVIAIDIRKPQRADWQEVIPQSADILSEVAAADQSLLAHYLVDAHSVVRLFSLQGKPAGELPLPALGAISSFIGRQTDTEVFYSFSGFTTPPAVYKFDVVSKNNQLVAKPAVAFEPTNFVTSQVFYKSKDGTQIPMFLVRKKDLELAAGPHPTFLYGYGGFDAAMLPRFRPDIIAWLERGGIFALPNLRGGGEYGEEWHKAGMKEKKQNVFDDFISAAHWLIDQKYTSSKMLAINGASNGGLLIGAALTQQPELFGAAVPEVGVLDMLRYHKFTIGHAWTGEYGSSDDAAAFAYLHAYSPLHNVRPARYPATLVITGDHDDRVFPAHSFKFMAALQSAQTGTAPVLIRIETSTGHGFGKPTGKQIEESADKWSFVMENTTATR